MASVRVADELVENEGVVCRRVPTCLLCGQEARPLYTGLKGRFFSAPGVRDIRWCGSCELAWLDPRPLAEEIPRLYSDYYTHEESEEEVGPFRRFRWWLRDGVLASRLGYEELAWSTAQRTLG